MREVVKDMLLGLRETAWFQVVARSRGRTKLPDAKHFTDQSVDVKRRTSWIRRAGIKPKK
jgi:hypothetical protein